MRCVAILCFALLGCEKTEPAATAVTAAAAPPVAHGVAAIAPLGTSGVTGNVRLTAEAGGVRLEGELQGLKPGPHGFHVHAVGDCSAPDGSSAGPHFNPMNKSHGEAHGESHLGDLGNLEAGSDGVAKVSVTKAGATLAPGETSYVGKAIVVHADPDDMKSQPAGASGARIACGVVKLEL